MPAQLRGRAAAVRERGRVGWLRGREEGRENDNVIERERGEREKREKREKRERE